MAFFERMTFNSLTPVRFRGHRKLISEFWLNWLSLAGLGLKTLAKDGAVIKVFHQNNFFFLKITTTVIIFLIWPGFGRGN